MHTHLHTFLLTKGASTLAQLKQLIAQHKAMPCGTGSAPDPFEDLRQRFLFDWCVWIDRLLAQPDQSEVPAGDDAIAFLQAHIHPKRLRELCERTDPYRQWPESQVLMDHLKLSAHFDLDETAPPEKQIYLDLDWAMMPVYRALASALNILETIERHNGLASHGGEGR